MGYQDKVDEITGRAGQTVSDAAEGVAKAADRLRKDSDAVQRDISNRADAFSDEMSDSIHKVQGDARNVQSALGDATRAVAKDLATLVRDRPLSSLAAAAVFGFVVGLLNSR